MAAKKKSTTADTAERQKKAIAAEQAKRGRGTWGFLNSGSQGTGVSSIRRTSSTKPAYGVGSAGTKVTGRIEESKRGKKSSDAYVTPRKKK